MCLDTKNSACPAKREGVAYKVFNTKKVLLPLWNGNGNEFKKGTRHHESEFRSQGFSASWGGKTDKKDSFLFTNEGARSRKSVAYPIGFHLFTNAKDAFKFANDGKYVRAVKYYRAHTIGKQWGYKVIVCPDIMVGPILKRVKEGR